MMFNSKMLVLLGLALTMHSAYGFKVGDEVCITDGQYKNCEGKISRWFDRSEKWGVKFLYRGQIQKTKCSEASLKLQTIPCDDFKAGDDVRIIGGRYNKSWGYINRFDTDERKWIVEVQLPRGVVKEVACPNDEMELNIHNYMYQKGDVVVSRYPIMWYPSIREYRPAETFHRLTEKSKETKMAKVEYDDRFRRDLPHDDRILVVRFLIGGHELRMWGGEASELVEKRVAPGCNPRFKKGSRAKVRQEIRQFRGQREQILIKNSVVIVQDYVSTRKVCVKDLNGRKFNVGYRDLVLAPKIERFCTEALAKLQMEPFADSN